MLITLQDYKTYKKISSVENDDRITAIIENVSEFIENYCGRKFKKYVETPYTEWFDGATNVVYPKYYPIIEVVEVLISEDGGLTQFTLDEQHPDGLGYFVDLQNDCVRTQNDYVKFVHPYRTPYRSLEITYKAGYEELPKDLQQAVINLTEYYFDKEYVPSKSLAGANVDNQPPYSSSSLPAHIRRVLDLYREAL